MRVRAFPFLADENVHPDVIQWLVQEGCTVTPVRDLNLTGRPDHEILAAAIAENRVVVTHDSDFGALAVARMQPIIGIVYLRPGHISAEFTIETLRTLFASPLDLRPPFVLVAIRTADKVRVRVRQLE